jgi:hypothetical protein
MKADDRRQKGAPAAGANEKIARALWQSSARKNRFE